MQFIFVTPTIRNFRRVAPPTSCAAISRIDHPSPFDISLDGGRSVRYSESARNRGLARVLIWGGWSLSYPGSFQSDLEYGLPPKSRNPHNSTHSTALADCTVMPIIRRVWFPVLLYSSQKNNGPAEVSSRIATEARMSYSTVETPGNGHVFDPASAATSRSMSCESFILSR